MFTVLAAQFLTRDERMTPSRLAGVTVGFCGVAVTLGSSAFAGLGDDLLAELAVRSAATSCALAGVFARRFRRRGTAPLVTAAGQATTSSAPLVPAALIPDQPWNLALPGLPTWGAVLGIAALSTALAYLL